MSVCAATALIPAATRMGRRVRRLKCAGMRARSGEDSAALDQGRENLADVTAKIGHFALE